MLTQRLPTRHMARLAAAALGAAVLSPSVLAGGPTQPDPPVPAEAHAGSDAPMLLASAEDVTREARTRAARTGIAEPDCRCGALYVRDLERRVEGHVERWEAMRLDSAMSRQPMAMVAPVTVAPPVALATPVVLHVDARAPVHLAASLVDGMVGFPLHDFRLAD
jgi:hypothetical protein